MATKSTPAKNEVAGTIPAAPQENRSVFAPPDNLPEGEERVDSEEGKPWHEVNSTPEKAHRVRIGEIFPMTRRQFEDAKKKDEETPREETPQ